MFIKEEDGVEIGAFGIGTGALVGWMVEVGWLMDCIETLEDLRSGILFIISKAILSKFGFSGSNTAWSSGSIFSLGNACIRSEAIQTTTTVKVIRNKVKNSFLSIIILYKSPWH